MQDKRQANTLDADIGRKIRERRLEIGMSQERLAYLLGVTFQQVQKYEKGSNRVAASRLWDIAGALDKAVEWFFPKPAAAVASRRRIKRVVGRHVK